MVMSVGATMSYNRGSLPAISQRRSSTLQEGYGIAGDCPKGAEMVGASASFTGDPSSRRMDCSAKSSCGSESRVSMYSDDRPFQGVAQTYSGVGASQHLPRDKIRFNGGIASERRTNNLLPRLIDDQGLLRVPKERQTFSSRSLEIFPSRDLISDELRMRTVSLPSLGRRCKQDGRRNPTMSDQEEEDCYTSYTTDDQTDEEDSAIVEIDPFPNVGADSYLNSRLLPDFLPPHLKPWTPGVRKTKPKKNRRNEEEERKKKKELEALAARERKKKNRGKSHHNRRRSFRTDAFARKRESEAAKRHPVRKQFVYSELVQVELQKLTPKRLPGGKLKPIYDRRTAEGDIDIPKDLQISLDNLSLKAGEDRIDFSDSPAAINKRRKQELQALLEKRKKLQRQMVHKKKRKVHFLLPEEDKRRHDVSARVRVADNIMQNETRSRSTTPGLSPTNDIEKTSDEQNENRQGISPSQIDHAIQEDSLKDGTYDGGHDYKTERTNSWVSNHTSHDPLEPPLDTQADTRVMDTTGSPNLSAVVPGNNENSQTRPVSVTTGSPIYPLNPDIPHDSAPISDLNSNFQVDGAPSSHQEPTSEEKRRHLSVDHDGAQAAQLNPLPGKRPDSPLLTDEGVMVADAPIRVESGAVREIKFLSERLPSIIISDT